MNAQFPNKKNMINQFLLIGHLIEEEERTMGIGETLKDTHPRYNSHKDNNISKLDAASNQTTKKLV